MVGKVIADRYDLEEVAGSGGMSSVYRAHDRLLERTVAIKILHEQFTDDPDYIERFRREARAVAQLTHPNIVTVIDRGEQDGRQYIVFEYLDGETLKQVLARGRMSLRTAVELALEIARALAFAHGRGIVHRDVKPQNVLLNSDGRAKVTDFGIARSLNIGGVTETGTVLGTSDYIAPEQARGEKVDAQTDVYSLGVVLYELLTGDVPFPGENFVAIAMRHVNEPPPSVLERRSDCPPRLDGVVAWAMAKDSAERPSMDELVGELDACLAELGGERDEDETMNVPSAAVRSGRRRLAAPAKRRRRLPVPLLVVALAVLAALAAAALLVRSALDDGSGSGPGVTTVRLAGVTSHDPEGDNTEHNEAVGRATDGNPSTYWPTETYNSFAKSGVGLVLDAGRPVALSAVQVRTDTPGFEAEIRAGSRSGGEFVPVSGTQTVEETTEFELDTKDEQYRYYVVWLRLSGGGVAHLNEVRAS